MRWGGRLHLNPKPIACIILPTYNEAENIASIIPEIYEQAKKVESHAIHIVVVDDNSPDGTRDRVFEFQKRFPNLHLLTGVKKGLGDAYKRGIAFSLERLQAELILQMDADGQHDPKWIPIFISFTNRGIDLVIGSRFVRGSRTPSFCGRRRFLSILGNRMIRFFSGISTVQDCTSGFRCMTAQKLSACNFNSLSARYSFQTALLIQLLQKDARAIEVPIVFNARRHGRSKLTVRDQVGFLLDIGRMVIAPRPIAAGAGRYRETGSETADKSGSVFPETAGTPAGSRSRDLGGSRSR